ncbi:tyrosine/serine protein phosphatase [Durotheca rogersii]|uniref:tyrosine/serine protein phosphatase n=1 Tax=Durotheca rogersii TaxID=419775 RepID=UPI00221F9476|nr:tyrosine/serine protein phosphatase [Durotheca rogersii]KAI5862812.1 tyrosine/serine protein phosphatase [Durotheca rogersii]
MSVALDKIANFRDVGKTVNDYTGRKLMREGALYRSAFPDDASAADRRRLVEEFGVGTIVDLRSSTEHRMRARKRRAAVEAGDPDPGRIPGVRYYEIALTGRRFEWFLLGQLSWWSYLIFFFLFLLGYRTHAIRLVSREVMLPRGLVGMGIIMLDESGAEIAEILRTLASSSRPVLLHCTQGKDRTGLIVILVLLALGAPPDAVTYDYMLSQEGLSRPGSTAIDNREFDREVGIGLTADWGNAPADFVPRVLLYLETRHRSIGGYLDGIGISVAERQQLVEALGA